MGHSENKTPLKVQNSFVCLGSLFFNIVGHVHSEHLQVFGILAHS